MPRLALALALICIGGCSLVNDHSRYEGDGAEADAGDVADADAGDVADADAGDTDGGATDAGSADGGAELEPIPAEAFCSELAQLDCEARRDCCDTGPSTDVDECIAAVTEDCRNDLEPLLTDDHTGYDPERAAQVIAGGDALRETCSTEIVPWYVFDVYSVMRGALGRDINCEPPDGGFEDDPAALWRCDADIGLVCRPKPAGGSACQGTSSEGGPCNTIYHCERGLYCTAFLGGVCQPQLDRGAVCTHPSQCRSLSCREGTCGDPDASAYCATIFEFYEDFYSD